jgi:mevalonate kinase
MGFVGTGHAKLLLFGEHAAVYGYPAVGLSLPAKTTARINVIGSPEWGLGGISQTDQKSVGDILLRLKSVVPETNRYGKGCVEISSTIPRGLGFGSSAALCTAVASAFYELLLYTGDLELTETEEGRRRTIWAWAHEVERVFHGTPSGVDTGLSVANGVYAFMRRSPERPLPEMRQINASPLNLVVGAVPRVGHTGGHVGGLRKRIAAGDVRAIRCVDELGLLAEEAIDLLEAGNSDESGSYLGELATRAHSLLRELELSSPQLERTVELGADLGATGGKLSGAGGGGAFYFVMPDGESALYAAKKLRKMAGDTVIPHTVEAIAGIGEPSAQPAELQSYK